MVLLYIVVSLILYVTTRELVGPRRPPPSSKGEHLKRTRTSQPTPNLPQRQAPKFPTWLIENVQFTRMSHYDWVDHSGSVPWKSSARMVTLPSIMPAFGSLTSECPWDPG